MDTWSDGGRWEGKDNDTTHADDACGWTPVRWESGD